MQSQSSQGVGIFFTSVTPVSNNGMIQILHVDTNLIFPACFKIQFYQRITITPFNSMVMCDRFLATVVRRTGRNIKRTISKP